MGGKHWGQDMSVTLLMTKLHMPRPHPHVVVRDRLLRQMTEGWRLGRRLTLISAPAGFGKTTLVTSWLKALTAMEAQKTAPDVAWLSLDADDSDVRRFLSYVMAALATVRPSLEGLGRALQMGPQLGSAPPDTASLLVQLINAVSGSPAPLILVLDDYHEIESPAVHDALGYLIDHLPREMRLVVATRTDPPLSLARLRTQDLLTEIRAMDLRFTLGEADAFLNQVMALDLADPDVAALEARTEGWAAGLQLAALSLRGRPPDRVKSFIADFSGTHRHIIDYLVEEVLAQQSDVLRSFMTQTSILAQLSAPLCAAVTGHEDAAVLLQQLVQNNLFVVPLDESRTWYRYHRLLAEFLRSRLNSQQPDIVHDLHLRAAAWYESAGILGQAVDHMLEAGEIERAARLMERAARDPLMRGETGVVLRWYEALPERLVRARPALAMLYAEALLIAGRIDEVMGYVAMVEARLAEETEPEDALICQVAAVRAYRSALQGDLDEGGSQAQRAMTHLPPDDDFLRATVMWLLGFMQYFQDDVAIPSQVLDTTIELSRASENQLIMALSVYVSALMQVLRGHLRAASQLAEQATGLVLEQAPRWQEGPSPAASMIDQVLAEIARERNDLASARAHINRCVRLATAWGNAEVLVDSYILKARICEAMGDIPEMQQALELVDALVAQGELAPLTIRQVEAHQARFHLYRGDLEAAIRWVDRWRRAHEDSQVIEPRVVAFVQWIERATVARVDLARGDYGAVLHLVAPFLQQMVKAGWIGVAIELTALQAVAFHGQGDLQAARAALDQALAWAVPEGYVRAFVDLGPPMARLLQQARPSVHHAADVRELLVALDAAVAGRPDWAEQVSLQRAGPGTATAAALIEPLSDRELEVLRLIAEGLTNREIAERLYIAVSTVKSHINNLYGKLAVNNRAHAVARAGELGLI